MPSQQSSFRGIRTALSPVQAFMFRTACRLSEPAGETIPQPWMHAYSVPDLLTPWMTTVCPAPFSILLPTTCRPLKDCSTVTVALWEALPPGPVQVSV